MSEFRRAFNERVMSGSRVMSDLLTPMCIYLPGTERLDSKYLRVNRYPDPDPTRFETNKYMDRNLDPNTFRVWVQI